MRRLLLVVAASVFFASPSLAGPLEDGTAALGRGDFAAALKLLQPLAGDGNPLAQTYVGMMYAQGQGVAQDYAAALRWFQRAAEQGNAAAQITLGNMYAKGVGTTQDDAQAVRWFRAAADQGQPLAQSNLGQMYAAGRGVKQDNIQAYLWLSLAAQRATDPEIKKQWSDDRDSLAKKMKAPDVAQAKKLVAAWKPAGAK